MKNLLAAICFFCTVTSYAQVGVGTSTPDASAQLDVRSTNKGVLIPRLTSTERGNIPSPARGLMVYDTDLNAFYFHNGTTWTPVGGSGSTPVAFYAPSVILANNSNGNGTFYLSFSGGSYTNEADGHRILVSPASTVTLSIAASGSLASPYTVSIRRGINNGSGFTYSDLSATTVTLTGATTQTINLTGLSLAAGETLAVKITGTAAFSAVGQQKTIYYSLLAK